MDRTSNILASATRPYQFLFPDGVISGSAALTVDAFLAARYHCPRPRSVNSVRRKGYVKRSELAESVSSAVSAVPAFDIHTHLYGPEFGPLLLRGIDELLTYHYLVCEAFLQAPMPYDKFWSMPKDQQADHVWEHLFVRNTPVSEAARGVATVIAAFGLEPGRTTLAELRDLFASMPLEQHLDTVFAKAHVDKVIMTNELLKPDEQAAWAKIRERDPRFLSAMRVDGILNDWKKAASTLSGAGYAVKTRPDAATYKEVRRFLGDCADKMSPIYLAASLPPSFDYPDASVRGLLFEKSIIPFVRERGLPLAVMLGVKRGTNPGLRMAGDTLGRADLAALERLCEANPDISFLATCLSRENQHQLCAVARVFHNLMVFGCWWFVNTPSMIKEITAERLELLGTRFVAQNSDARVLDQLIYKWAHARKVVAEVLTDKYADLLDSGWALKKTDIERDVTALFGDNFTQFAKHK